MDDTLLVSRAMAGDLDSFGQLHDRYFPRVYDFAWRVVRDADEAASVTESVFATAMTSLSQLPHAASFRAWLFAIAFRSAVARAAGLGRTSGAVHEEAFGSFDVPDACFVSDPTVAGGDAATAALVWEAATALNPRDYAVLDLHVRQGLDSAEIAAVLAMGKSNAYTLVTRMKSAAADVMTGYILARTGNKSCDALQRTLAPFDLPPYTDEIRRAVDAHSRECETCASTRKAIPEPLAVLGAFAAVKPPMSLKGDVWRSIAASWHVPRAQASIVTAGVGDVGTPGGGAWQPAPLAAGGGIGLGGGGFGGAGFTGAESSGWDRKRVVWFAGAAAGMLVFAFAVGTVLVWAVGSGGGDGGVATATKTPTVTPTATAVVSLTPGVAVSSSTPESPTAVPTETETPPPTPTDTPVPATATNTPRVRPRTATPSPVKTTGVASATPTPKKTAVPTPTKAP